MMKIISSSTAIAQTLLANLPVGILVYQGNTGNCIMANAAAADMLDRSVEALRQQNFQALASRCQLAEWALHERLSGHHEVTLQRANGKNIALDCFISMFDVEDKPHLMCIFSDITERKQTHKKLEKERALLRCLIDSASDLIFIKDQDSVYRACNKASEAFIGIPESEQIGKTDHDFFDAKTAALIRAVDRQVMETGKPVRSEEWVTYADGHNALMDTVKFPYRGPDGDLLGLVGIARDITERRRAEEALKESEAKYMDLYENAPDMYASVDARTALIEECNMTLANTLGYAKEEIIGRPVFELYHSDCLTAAKNAFNLFAETGEIHDNELQLRRKDGSKLDVRLNASAVRGENGRILFSRSTMHDITEHKRAEEKMLRSDQRLRLHSEQSPLAFLEWDDNFHAVEWNAACERIFGYTREEAIGRHAKDLILPGEVHELVDAIFHSLMSQTGGQHSINENVTKDGRIIICEWFNTTLIDRDGKAIGVASVCRDITEQTRMEAELARYREQLEEQVKARTAELEITRNKAQQYLDIAGVILVALDKNRRVTLINQKGCDILENTSGEIIGKDWFETFVPENARQDTIQGFRQLMAGELEPVEYFENPVLTRNGEERLVAWHNVLLRDSEGNITGTLSSGEDITEKKHAEKQIIKLNQDLRQRAAALEAANKELDAFAFSVSHDLRAPLRHIDGFIEMLPKKAGAMLDEQGLEYMSCISDAAERMGRLIDELLSFSRMGRQAMLLQQVDLESLVRDIIRELEPDTAGRNIEWGIGELPAVSGDASMLRVVLNNLIANAVKFTRPRQRAKIEIGSLPGQSSEAVVFVRDNGVGFDMAYAERLFGVFQRLHREDEFEGTGIGLASVGRIIARHGGRTWAQGGLDQGATFFFSLPHMAIGKDC